MLASHAALWESTGSPVMGVFQTLSAGNIGQLGAPGTGVPADATEGAAPRVSPRHIIPTAAKATGTAVLRRRTGAPSRHDRTRAGAPPVTRGLGARTTPARDDPTLR